MNEGQLWLDPVRALDGARNLTTAGGVLASLRVGPGSELQAATEARPWGADDIGDAFHRQYAPMAGKILDAWQQVAAYVEGLGDAAGQSVRLNQQADGEAGVNIARPYQNG